MPVGTDSVSQEILLKEQSSLGKYCGRAYQIIGQPRLAIESDLLNFTRGECGR
jgi:hypothetical protein